MRMEQKYNVHNWMDKRLLKYELIKYNPYKIAMLLATKKSLLKNFNNKGAKLAIYLLIVAMSFLFVYFILVLRFQVNFHVFYIYKKERHT